ncbi:MAG: nucleotide pyrophosphohydrolase [Pseudomonadota bacterium]
MSDIEALTKLVTQFRDDRNWKQFHNLKDLIISLNLEASELLELTQWKGEAGMAQARSEPQFQQALEEECADVLLYLLLIAQESGIDLAAAAKAKIAKNALRYPIAAAFGSSRKYTALDADQKTADGAGETV